MNKRWIILAMLCSGLEVAADNLPSLNSLNNMTPQQLAGWSLNQSQNAVNSIPSRISVPANTSGQTGFQIVQTT